LHAWERSREYQLDLYALLVVPMLLRPRCAGWACARAPSIRLAIVALARASPLMACAAAARWHNPLTHLRRFVRKSEGWVGLAISLKARINLKLTAMPDEKAYIWRRLLFAYTGRLVMSGSTSILGLPLSPYVVFNDPYNFIKFTSEHPETVCRNKPPFMPSYHAKNFSHSISSACTCPAGKNAIDHTQSTRRL
jgi:hypothetical protein